MIVRQALIPESKYALKCPHVMTPVGICVHNTANDASAQGEITYMTNNGSQTSFHYAVDDIGAVQGLPLNRNGWHAGDGNGDGNRKHIGIEICYSKSGGERFIKAEQNAVELIVTLLKERGWGIERVKKHQDFSGKYCPHRTLDLGWDRFLNMIKNQLFGNSEQLPGGNMTHQQFYEKFLENFKRHKDDIEWGDDKHKNESVFLSDPAVLQRMLDNIAQDKKNKEAEINRLKEQLANQQPSVPPVPPFRVEAHGSSWELNGLSWVNGAIHGNYKKV